MSKSGPLAALGRDVWVVLPPRYDQVSDTKRTEAFSDGVLAIAITLVVLDLECTRGQPGSLAHALAREWPAYGSYITSFLIIGIIWGITTRSSR